jgi:hypothetical protein
MKNIIVAKLCQGVLAIAMKNIVRAKENKGCPVAQFMCNLASDYTDTLVFS